VPDFHINGSQSVRSCEDSGRRIVVVGGGPAGVAAAVQLKRGGFDPLLFERERLGGLLREAHLIENYPGFPRGVGGRELADRLAAHAEVIGVSVIYEEVVLIERDGGAFSVHTPRETTIAGTVVIASGTRPNVLKDVLISQEAAGRMRYGIVGLESLRGGRVAVIGGGDAAFDYALNLSGRNEVIILHRSDRRRCIPVLWERCEATLKISYRSNVTVKEIVSRRGSVVLRCRDGVDGGEIRLAVDHVVVAIGRSPQLDFLDRGIKERIDELRQEELLYLIGDVVNGPMRQAAISAGDGVRVAMEILDRQRNITERDRVSEVGRDEANETGRDELNEEG
jgi:thioredoxin reductase (NADPH)